MYPIHLGYPVLYEKSDFRVPGPSLVGWTDNASAHPNCVFAQGKLHVTILLLTGKKMRNLQ